MTSMSQAALEESQPNAIGNLNELQVTKSCSDMLKTGEENMKQEANNNSKVSLSS